MHEMLQNVSELPLIMSEVLPISLKKLNYFSFFFSNFCKNLFSVNIRQNPPHLKGKKQLKSGKSRLKLTFYMVDLFEKSCYST